jgi:hypothetical protein
VFGTAGYSGANLSGDDSPRIPGIGCRCAAAAAEVHFVRGTDNGLSVPDNTQSGGGLGATGFVQVDCMYTSKIKAPAAMV